MFLRQMNYDGMVVNPQYPHLGGFSMGGDPSTYYPHMWKKLLDDLNINSIVDVGCGRGYSTEYFYKNFTTDVLGLDGCEEALRFNLVPQCVKKVDFTCETFELEKTTDLCWSCEFVEHVREEYCDNFLNVFGQCRYIAMTYAEPDQGGHHHVNEQNEDYWVSKIESMGFKFDKEYTEELKQVCEQDRIMICPQFEKMHFQNHGLFFRSINNND